LTDDEHGDGHGYTQLLLVVILVLGLAATALVVLSNDPRFLRVGVLAALWAALIGAFLTVRYRKEAAVREDDAVDLRTIYELELAREVAARREYELEVEATLRREVQEEAKGDLDALRGELHMLRENLEALVGGQVLVERVALRAESTRMRALSDQSRLLAMGDDRMAVSERRKAVTIDARGNQSIDDRGAPTELLERVPKEPSVSRQPHPAPTHAPAAHPTPAHPAPARPRESHYGPARQPVRATAKPAEPSQTVRSPAQVHHEQPSRPQRQPHKPERRQPQPYKTAIPGVAATRVRPSDFRQPEPADAAVRHPLHTPTPPTAPSTHKPAEGSRTTPPPASMPAPKPEGPPSRHSLIPAPARPVTPEQVDPAHAGGDRDNRHTGRRRRLDNDRNEEVSRYSTPGGWPSDPLIAPFPYGSTAASASAARSAVPAGAHAAGKSVSELLASYGRAEPTSRRHRRDDD